MANFTTHIFNEIDILERLAQSDEMALDAIYRHYWERLFIVSYNILKDRQACEDIIQDVFVKLWANREKLNISLSLKSYLFASCRYALYRQIRANKFRLDISEGLEKRLSNETVFGRIEHQELVSYINSIIEQLPPKCREVYLLSRNENLSYKEIAERLSISVKTVENHINRALHEIRDSLSDLLTIELILMLLESNPDLYNQVMQ